MHHRLLVTFNKDTAATSQDARDHVFEALHDEGFCCESGRWRTCIADWFVIGGRWSGFLSRLTWAKEFDHVVTTTEAEHETQVWGAWYGDRTKQKVQRKLAKQFQALWDSTAPPAYIGIPYQRDTYKVDGYEDDAMLLTRELYDSVLYEFAGRAESDHHADLDFDDVSPGMIGRKWLVVVDYHT